MDIGECMTKEEIWSLPTGTFLRRQVHSQELFQIGLIRKRKDKRFFHIIHVDGRKKKFELLMFSKYSLSSKEEYVLWKLGL